MRQFKSKKIKKRKKHPFIFIFFFIFSYVFVSFYISKNRANKNILNNKNNYINFNLVNFLSNKTDEIINKPVSLLNNNIKNASYTVENKNKISVKENISKPKTEKVFNPVIYVYNTHQSENYTDYNVVDAASYLSDKLSTNGYDTYFEQQSITTFLQENSMKYYKSYTVSRKYLDQAKQKYPAITYFFDIHRDALSKEKSTLCVDKKNYAKILFIVGTDNKLYQSNLTNATKLNEIINSMVPGITKGIMQKGGKGVNGVYNQDVSSNVFLIEIGGNNNNKQEVINSIDVLVEAIKQYIRGVI